VRLFADLAGRLLPRARALTLATPAAVLGLAVFMISLTPLFYLYVVLAPPWFRSDTLACGAPRLACASYEGSVVDIGKHVS